MIVKKAANMADMMKVPVLGLVENMSYIKCPDCGKEIKIFGDSHIDEIAEEFGYDLLARVPIDPQVAAFVDAGAVERVDCDYFSAAADKLIEKCNK
jgi:Mrp family chromosome partitioning ATPase